MVPGLRYRLRRKSNRTAIARSRPKRKRRALDEACLGKSCHWHDFCSSTARPAFAGSPWPDLPRCGPDRCSGPHPPVPALPTRTVPDPAPGRADDHHRMRGCAPDSAGPEIPAQAGIHLPPSPEALEEEAGDGPLPSQGPAGGEHDLHPPAPCPRRMPGSPAVRARSQPREAPAYAGDAEKGDDWAWPPRLRVTHLRRLSEMGPQTLRVGGDARRRAQTLSPYNISPADAGASCGKSAEPAAGDSGIRRRCGERKRRGEE